MSTAAGRRDAALRELKDQARATWAAGNYDAIAEGIWEAGEVVVDRVGVREGERVIDVACGTGNAALRAAGAGGRVVGLDITPEMFPAARRRAADAGVTIEWVEGDAEALPFADESFDVIVSTFGVMFAPRQAVATAEMARVLLPGGRVGLTSWTPEGSVGNVLGTVARHLPPLPDFAGSPLMWGFEDHVRALFDGTGVELAFERRRIELDPDIDVGRGTRFYLDTFGPIVQARAVLEPEGRWSALLDELGPAIERMLTDPAEYLLTIGTKAG